MESRMEMRDSLSIANELRDPPAEADFELVDRSEKEELEITLNDGDLLVGGEKVLQGIQNGIHESKEGCQFSVKESVACALLVDLRAEASKAQHEYSLGDLRVEKWMSNSRYKLWWMMPCWGKRGCDVPPETQMLLCKLQRADTYVVFLPMIDRGNTFRSSLVGSRRRNETQRIMIRVESNCDIVEAKEVSGVLLVSASRSPFDAMSSAIRHASVHLGSFQPRGKKVIPPSVDVFGWCTWDAFYSSVDAQGIELGIASLVKGGCPPKCLIIDDGWQSTAADRVKNSFSESSWLKSSCEGLANAFWTVWAFLIAGWYLLFVHTSLKGSLSMKIWEYMVNNFIGNWIKMEMDKRCDFTKRLTSPFANQKFQGADNEANSGLADLISTLKGRYGVQYVYCWHAMTGYWGGVCPSSKETSSFEAELKKTKHYPGVTEVEPFTDWDAFKLAGVGVIPPSRISDFYMCLHDGLKRAGVDGVKVDVQALVGALGHGLGGGPQLTYTYHKALEMSVGKHFPGNHLINCMCHSNENLFRYAETNIVRASDDFYPKDRASHTVHIVNVVYNSFFLGEIAIPDWDMFHSKHEAGHLHAAARAIGGCSIYVSDKPGNHNFELLSKLVLPDGRTLRCKLPGRPTRDCLFEDVQRDGLSALKIWNKNAVTGVVGAFNVQGVSYNRFIRAHVFHRRRLDRVLARVSPIDVENFESPTGLFSCYCFKKGFQGLVDSACTTEVALSNKDWEIVSYAPVWRVNEVQFSPIGLVDMFNLGGCISQVEVSENRTFDLQIQGSGRFLCYCNTLPRSCVLSNAGLQESKYSIHMKLHMPEEGLLELHIPNIDGSLAHQLRIEY